MRTRKSYINSLIIIFLLLASGLFFNWERLNEFPANIHAWAQADRYAIALGYIDNGFDFFHPQTYVLNKQFPGYFRIPFENGISSVDFPIHDYLVALTMKALGTREPWVFRFYTLIYSIIGLFFLYKSSVLLGNSHKLSGFIALFAASSPVFAYYQAGFLPSIPSLANATIGLYFYIKYLKSGENKGFFVSIFFLSLAALGRSSFFLAFASVMAVEALNQLKQWKINWKRILAMLGGLLVLTAYFLYNRHLRDVYGSMFLNSLLPPANVKNGIEIIDIVWNNWKLHYFSITQYLIFILTIISIVLLYIRRRSQSFQNEPYHVSPLVFFLVYLLAAFCFFIAMMRQFQEHDYYFIDSFYLPIVLIFCYLVSKFSQRIQQHTKLSAVLLIILGLGLLVDTKITDNSRRKTGYWDRTALSIKNYRTAGGLFKSAGIAKDAKILVVDATAPNIPFILMDRKGYNGMECSEAFFKHSFNWDYHYFVAQTEFVLSEIYQRYPDFIRNFEKIASNGYLTVFKKREVPIETHLENFLEVEGKKPDLSFSMDYEMEENSAWREVEKIDSVSFSGKYAGILKMEDEFGLTFETVLPFEKTVTSHVLRVSSAFYGITNSANPCKLVVSVNSSNTDLYYQLLDFNHVGNKTDEWQSKSFYFILPAFDNAGARLSVYLWNPDKSQLIFDNFTIDIF